MAGPEPAQAPLLLYGARLPAGCKANTIRERWLPGHTAGHLESPGSSSPVDAHSTPPSRTIVPAERQKKEALPSLCCRGGAAMRLSKRQYI